MRSRDTPIASKTFEDAIGIVLEVDVGHAVALADLLFASKQCKPTLARFRLALELVDATRVQKRNAPSSRSRIVGKIALHFAGEIRGEVDFLP
jgi:hypothetical protein